MVKIYQNEIKAGLAKQIAHAHTSIATALFVPEMVNSNVVTAKTFESYSMNVPEDCMQLWAVLVSTTWNKNDDVFVQEDTWKARYTPRFKPANMEHQGTENTDNKIFGVITDAVCANEKMEMCSEEIYNRDTEQYDVNPEFKHLVANIILWEKYFPNTVAKIKEQINSGEMGVSMECIFKDFGYALTKEGSNEDIMLMERNDITSFMTLSLRAYGGSGKINLNGENYRIGRWLKNFKFSGVGFTTNPANPESIIFDNYISHASVVQNYKIVEFDKNSVFNNCKGDKRLWIF